MRRYSRDQRISGGLLQTAKAVSVLRRARDFGLIQFETIVIQESQRLDHIAYDKLGNPHDWWVIAALSDIGWGLQVPPGTILKIPIDRNAIAALVN